MAKTKTATTVNIKPLGDHLLVRRLEAEEKTKGGIVLPDTAKEKPKEGVVIAIGQGRTLESGERVPPSVKPDARVIFSSYAGTEVKWEGEEYLLIREEDILGVVEG